LCLSVFALSVSRLRNNLLMFSLHSIWTNNHLHTHQPPSSSDWPFIVNVIYGGGMWGPQTKPRECVEVSFTLPANADPQNSSHALAS
jgi:hypothetical protein